MREFVRDEGGFTLPEMLVTIMVMVAVLFALYSVFDMSLRVFDVGNDKVEATDNARLGLEKMAREIRAAYPANKISGSNHLFWTQGAPATATMPTAGQITFGNDRNGNRRVYNSSTGTLDPNEEITYAVSGTTLQRNGQPVVEFVQDVDAPPDGTALKFEYLDANGATVTSEANIVTVRIKLEVAVDRGIQEEPVTQTLQTKVTLRNRVDQL
jgi:prepilin-type N-terminal cleavage/methylation domain-containing protein